MPGRLVGGVCAALATHFNWDVTVMRVVLVGVTLVSGLGVWLYAALWLLTPFEAHGRAPGLRVVDWLGRLFSPPAKSPPANT